MNNQKNIVLCGVGGQGTVLASKLLAAAAMSKDIPVMSAETIGMAQRGGSVFSHLRMGDNLYSPMIETGTADLIIGFEPGAVSYTHLLKICKQIFLIYTVCDQFCKRLYYNRFVFFISYAKPFVLCLQKSDTYCSLFQKFINIDREQIFTFQFFCFIPFDVLKE